MTFSHFRGKMDIPVVLINSCSNYIVKELVKGILESETLPDEKILLEKIASYPWSIETKYYTADVQLCTTEERTIGNESFASCVEAFVVYFDPEKVETFQQVKSWLSYLEQLDPEIKMLVCDRCTENSSIDRLTAQTWCIDNGFELVELNAEEMSDSETEDDFYETTGMKRIIQSLHAHSWPNLVLKDSRSVVSPYIRQLMKEEHETKQAGLQNKDDNTETDSNGPNTESDRFSKGVKEENKTSKNKTSEKSDSSECESVKENKCSKSNKIAGAEKLSQDSTDTNTDLKGKENNKKSKQPSREERIDNLFPSDQTLFETLGQEDPGGQSFEQLFEQFATMKEKANSLPPEERKKYAETVAIAFWRAMGGDEDEIGDLDD